jgi:cobalamin biosynthetic protein CobC
MTVEDGDRTRGAPLERLFLHGGDTRAAAAVFPGAPQPWVDLSTGVNPIAYPISALPTGSWQRLPDPSQLQALHTAAAERYCASPDCVAAAPGTQAIIQWLPRLFPAHRVAVVDSTYSEHERSWRASGSIVDIIPGISAIDDHRAIVVVNPNNPDGRLYSRQEMADLADRLERNDQMLIVDEAFMDFERESVIPELRANVVVLRSFGKAYGLSGLRLGFALATPDRVAIIRRALGPWAISGPALEIGCRALLDREWLDGARGRLHDDVQWLDVALAKAGFEAVGGGLLFRLVRHPRARERFEQLCGLGILSRPFRAPPEWLRFGPPTPSLRGRLLEALSLLPT